MAEGVRGGGVTRSRAWLRQDHSMTADWNGTLTEERYATQGSRHLRALLTELKPGPLADALALPAGVTVSWEGDVLRFSAAVPELLGLVDELRKLARSPSGSVAQLDDVRLEVNNELVAPSTERTVRLPWHGWHAVAQACELFAAHERQAGRTVRFDYYNFSTGKWHRDRDREPLTATPLSSVRVEFMRLGPSKADLDLDADNRHRAEQRGLTEGERVVEVDHVTELELPWPPGGGAPEPRLWLSEQEAVLAYRVGLTGTEPGTFAVLRFPRCQFAMFGTPGHNVLFLYPLHPQGLELYGIYEVLNSSFDPGKRQWMTDARGAPRAASPGSPSGSRGSSRHFIITFHDQTLSALLTTSWATPPPISRLSQPTDRSRTRSRVASRAGCQRAGPQRAAACDRQRSGAPGHSRTLSFQPSPKSSRASGPGTA